MRFLERVLLSVSKNHITGVFWMDLEQLIFIVGDCPGRHCGNSNKSYIMLK